MDLSQLYFIISILILLIIIFLVFFIKKNKKERKLSPLTSLAFVFVIIGIVFGDNKLMGYGLISIGILLALIDMVNKKKD